MFLTKEHYPTELLLALNKAKTVSWRLGVAWTLASSNGKILTCNGNIFNQHTQKLIQDIHAFNEASKLYISYCPQRKDVQSESLLTTLRQSPLSEVHVHAEESERTDIKQLSEDICIPVSPWNKANKQSTQNMGIPWVRTTSQPWIHVVCSSSLGGGEVPLSTLSEQMGVLPYVTLKGIGSSILYLQSENNLSFGKKLRMAEPRLVQHKQSLVRKLRDLNSSTASLVTVICTPDWLALLTKLSLANEVTYFISINSSSDGNTQASSIVNFPDRENWIISSSETLGKFMRIVLQRKNELLI